MYTNEYINATGCLNTIPLNFVIFSNKLVTDTFESREEEKTDVWGCYDFICGLFSDSVSNLNYIVDG
jgi:hypothetical protein